MAAWPKRNRNPLNGYADCLKQISYRRFGAFIRMNRSRKGKVLDDLIGGFLFDYKQVSHLDPIYGGAYVWNEREAQWLLTSYLKERMVSYSVGSPWWIHAEGGIGRPRYARKEDWKATRRADIVMVDHSKFKRWYSGRTSMEPPYIAMIELKLFWSGGGRAWIEPQVEGDVKKLQECLSDGTTIEAYSVILDGVDRYSIPYLNSAYLKSLKSGTKLQIFHWPDSESPITNFKEADFHRY